MENLGAVMRVARARRRMSQADLATAIGRSVWRVWRIERGLSRPREEELKSIAEVLGFDGAGNDISVLGDHDERHPRPSEQMLPFDDVTLEHRRDE